MPNVIHHAHRPPHVQHGMLWYFFWGMTIAFIMVLVLSLLPTITFPGTIIEESYYRDVAKQAYLQGEKVLYTNPVELNNALAAYHAGEKTVYTISNAIWSYRIGEKSAVLDIRALNAEDVLYEYRMGEKYLR